MTGRYSKRQALETVFPSDDDEDGAWKAWGAPDELGLPGNAGNVPFSSGTEGEQDGQEFEIAMRRMFSLQEKEFKCSNMDEGYKARLERAHKRLQRDLAAVQCSRTLPKSSLSQISAQVDGVGGIALEQLRSSTWVVKPASSKQSLLCGRNIAERKAIGAEDFSTWENRHDALQRRTMARWPTDWREWAA